MQCVYQLEIHFSQPAQINRKLQIIFATLESSMSIRRRILTVGRGTC